MPSLMPEYETRVTLVRLNSELGHDVTVGVHRFLGNRRWGWNRAETPAELAEAVADPKVAGVIGHISDRAMAEALRESGLPVVNTSGSLPEAGFPHVGVDDEETGRLAARHLADAGFVHFLFVGIAGHGYSEARCRGFKEVLAGVRGANVAVVEFNLADWKAGYDQVARSLADRPKPLGVFGCRDPLAVDVCRVAQQVGLHVPTEVAVMGVDNVRQTCEFHQPALSSIALPWEEVGYVAADLLDRMMGGRPPPDAPVLLPPTGVVKRASTDVLAVDDPVLREGLRLVEARACRGLTAGDLADELALTRQALLETFREHLGRTPGEYIRGVRLKRARDLLVQTDRDLADVALTCGYATQSHFTQAFKKATGYPPGAYRKRHRFRRQ